MRTPTPENQASLPEASESAEKRLRVAIYCRVSTNHEQSLKSLENQILSYIELVQCQPAWRLQGIYSDRGLSGTSIRRRESFKRLLKHCEAGKIDLVITKSISRFARNTHDLLGVLRRLRQLHVDVVFEKEGIRMSEANDEFMLTLYAAMAQNEAVTISKNITWAYRKKAEQGRPAFRSLYGYRVVGPKGNKTLEPIPQQAEIVREVFRRFNEGDGFAAIIKWLADAGIPTQKGHRIWRPHTIRSMLENEKYAGNTRITKHPTALSPLKTDMNTPSEDIFIRNSHPALVPQETYEAARKRLQEDFKPFGKLTQERRRLPLTGRIRCGHCGANYGLFYKGPDISSFACSARRRHKAACPSRPITESQFLDLAKRAYLARFAGSNPARAPETPLAELQRHLRQSCDLDGAEEKRLSKIIDIARLGQAIPAAQNKANLMAQKAYLEEDFRRFEQDLETAERDRGDRTVFYGKLLRFDSLEAALSSLTLSDLYALIPSVEVFSPENARITWHDRQQTVLGTCRPEPLPMEPPRKQPAPPPASKAPAQDNAGKAGIRTVEPANQKAVMARTILNTGKALLAVKPPEARRLRVCAYCRTSKAEEANIQSLSRQVAAYTHAIMIDPAYEFAGIYTDHGKSGLHTRGRGGFEQMIEDAKDGKFDLILTKSVSRFGRNVVDILETVRMLRALPTPVTVLFENEGLHSDASRHDFMLSLYGALAQNESRSLSETVTWGKTKTILNGTFKHPGPLPYGYRKDREGRWQIAEEQAAVIRRIFRESLRGSTDYAVASGLTKDGVPTARGGHVWRPSTIYRILRNLTYTGQYLYGRHIKPDLHSPRRLLNKGESEQYLIEEHHPAIVDRATWQAAQKAKDARCIQRSNTRNRMSKSGCLKEHAALFKGRITCGQCQAPAVSRQFSKDKTLYTYWRCTAATRRVEQNRCPAPSVRHELIEHAFMVMLLRQRQETHWHPLIAAHCTRLRPATLETDRLRHLKSRQSELYDKIHRSVLVEQTQNVQLIDRITSCTEQILAINTELEELEHTRKTAQKQLQFLKDLPVLLSKVPKFNPGQERIRFDADLFDKLVTSVTLIGDKQVQFNLLFDHAETIAITGYMPHRLPWAENPQ